LHVDEFGLERFQPFRIEVELVLQRAVRKPPALL
jgi:hypothetical protein